MMTRTTTNLLPDLRPWAVLPLLLMAALAAPGCAGSNGGGETATPERQLTEEEKAHLVQLADTHKKVAAWRSENLPELLDSFGTSNPAAWREARAILLSKEMVQYTPTQKRISGNETESTYIRARLEAPDWNTPRSRRWLVRQGLIYRQVGILHDRGSFREDWQRVRKTLVELSEADLERQRAADAEPATDYEKADVPAERLAFELVLKLLARPDKQSAEADAQDFSWTDPGAGVTSADRLFKVQKPANADWLDRARSNPMDSSYRTLRVEDRALWAVDELVELGEWAIAPIIWGTWLSDRVGATPEGVRFYELLYLALARMDELAVPALLLDLENSMKLDDPAWRFHRVRRLVRTLGEVYGPETFTTPERVEREPIVGPDGAVIDQGYEYIVRRDRIRPEWQQTAKHREDTLKAITGVMRNFHAKNDTQQFQMRNYCIDAIMAIGDASGCPHLIELWADVKSEEDEFLEDLIREALMRLSGRSYRTLDDWRTWWRAQKDGSAPPK